MLGSVDEARDALQDAFTAVANSTELQRDLAVFRTMKNDLQAMTFGLANDQSAWGAVHRRIQTGAAEMLCYGTGVVVEADD